MARNGTLKVVVEWDEHCGTIQFLTYIIHVRIHIGKHYTEERDSLRIIKLMQCVSIRRNRIQKTYSTFRRSHIENSPPNVCGGSGAYIELVGASHLSISGYFFCTQRIKRHDVAVTQLPRMIISFTHKWILLHYYNNN